MPAPKVSGGAGRADAQIAAILHLSPRTVGNHLGTVYRKLGVNSRTAAIRQAYRDAF